MQAVENLGMGIIALASNDLDWPEPVGTVDDKYHAHFVEVLDGVSFDHKTFGLALDRIYDPANGTVSRGDIQRWGGETHGMPTNF